MNNDLKATQKRYFQPRQRKEVQKVKIGILTAEHCQEPWDGIQLLNNKTKQWNLDQTNLVCGPGGGGAHVKWAGTLVVSLGRGEGQITDFD